MSHYRTEEEVRNYDIFKGIVTALLLVTLFIVAALGYDGAGEEAAAPASEAETAEEAAGSADEEIAEAPESVEGGAPDLLSPAPGTALEAGTETFSGMGTPGSQMALVAGGVELGRTLVDENGTWEMEVDLPPGVETIELQAIDSSGNVVASSPPIPMTSADTAATPEEEAAEPTTPPNVNFPEGELVAGQTITLSGTGQPGASVQLLANNADIGTVTVAEDGTWTLEVTLPEGDYEIDAAVLDEAGNVLDVIPAISIPVLPPEAPRFVLPESSIPEFNPLTGSVAWNGESAPGSRVAAIVDDEIVTEATADSEGQWNLGLDLEPGSYNLAFAQLDENGEISSSTEPVAIEVPAQLPQLDLPDDALAAGDGSGLPVAQFPEGPVVLTGTAEAGQEVALLINGQVSATAIADEEGNFSLPAELSGATKSLQIGLVGDDGTMVAKSAEVAVSTGETVAEAPAEGEAEEPAEGEAEEPAEGEAEEPAEGEAEEPAEGEGEEPAEGEGEATEEEEETPGVSGTVTYLERIAIPGDAVVTVQILNLSLADASAEVLGEQIIEVEDRQIPIPYKVPYDPAAVNENLLYGVTARIEGSDGTLLFISDTNTPVITSDAPIEEVEIVTVAVGSAASDAELGVGDAELAEDTDTVLGAMEASGQFTILLDGIEEAGLTDRLAQTDGAFTVFAPTDEAFESMPPGILAGWNFNPEEFANILRNMVLEGNYEPDDLTDGLVLRSIAGINVGIQHIGELISVNGVPVIDAAAAGESYVYALPQVILPPLPAGVTAPSIDVGGVPTFVGEVLTVVGVGEPGQRIALGVNDERFGDVVMVDSNGFWLVEGEISPGIHNIIAYMIGDDGLLQALSQEVTLAVSEP